MTIFKNNILSPLRFSNASIFLFCSFLTSNLASVHREVNAQVYTQPNVVQPRIYQPNLVQPQVTSPNLNSSGSQIVGNTSTSVPPKYPDQANGRNQQECNGSQILKSPSCTGDGLEPEEKRLYDMISTYRAQNGLPPISISSALTLVANRHVQDLEKNLKQLTHGWSDCPYNPSNSSTYPCMWNAPQRLGTGYNSYGYENAHGASGGYIANAQSAFNSWQGSAPHNAVILNQGVWRNYNWKSVGVGIYKGYAVLWFGDR